MGYDALYSQYSSITAGVEINASPRLVDLAAGLLLSLLGFE